MLRRNWSCDASDDWATDGRDARGAVDNRLYATARPYVLGCMLPRALAASVVAVCGLILGGRCVQNVMTEAEMEPAQVISDQVMGGGGWRGVELSCGNNQIFRACPAHGLLTSEVAESARRSLVYPGHHHQQLPTLHQRTQHGRHHQNRAARLPLVDIDSLRIVSAALLPDSACFCGRGCRQATGL